jgi:GABA(A) receptor-associated protein
MSMYKFEFKERNSYEKRKAESSRIKAKYPDRIPVICEIIKPTDLPELDKHKFLVPTELTVGQFLHVIRKRMDKLNPDQALFLFVNNSLPMVATQMSVIYKQDRDEDGFLYIAVKSESTFGVL